MKTALFVVSAADGWTLKNGKVHPTGYWAEELAEPHRLLTQAGWSIDFATPGGVAPRVDQLSLGVAGGLPKKRKRVETYLNSIENELNSPLSLDAVDEASYDLVFYPGGHGPMEDLAFDPVSGALLTQRMEAGRPLALLCHAPAAVLAAGANGVNPFVGRRMTALSNLEERFNPFAWQAQWFLETALKEAGVDYEKATLPFRPYVVVDENLFTGQNPQSAEALATRLIRDLR